MELISFLTIITIVVTIINLNECNEGFTIKNVLPFPWPGNEFIPFMGLIVAIAFPLHIPNYNVFLSFNLEINYNLPLNVTEYSYPPILSKRSLDRNYFYQMLEKKFISHGFKGKPCLLRMICEAAEHNLLQNGILGDILHILLAPSSSNNTKLDSIYSTAEKYGKNKGHCKKYIQKCTFSLLNLISITQDV